MEASSACELFRRCLDRRGGEPWREFHRLYDSRIRRTVLRAFLRGGLRPGKPDLDEFVQDLYCRLLTASGRRFGGRTEPELWTYLDRVARSVAEDHRRAAQATKRRAQAIASGRCPPDRDRPGHGPPGHRRPGAGEAGGDETAAEIDQLAARQVSPEERCLINEYRRFVLARCRKLCRNDRAVTVLRLAILEGWTSREISRRLDGALTANQIDILVCRLRRRLTKEGIRLPSRRECQRRRP